MSGMTYEEVMEFALAHYNEGGDATYECIDRKMFEERVKEFGPYTKEKLLAEFKLDQEIRHEYEAMAEW